MNVKDFYSLNLTERVKISESIIRTNKLITSVDFFLSKTHRVFLVVYENGELLSSISLKMNDEIGYIYRNPSFKQFGEFLFEFYLKIHELDCWKFFILVNADNQKSLKFISSMLFQQFHSYTNNYGNTIIRFEFEASFFKDYCVNRMRFEGFNREVPLEFKNGFED